MRAVLPVLIAALCLSAPAWADEVEPPRVPVVTKAPRLRQFRHADALDAHRAGRGVHDLSAQQVAVAQEVCDEARRRAAIDVERRADLLDAALPEHHDAIGEVLLRRLQRILCDAKVALVRRDRVVELLQLDVRAVVGVDGQLELGVDGSDLGEHGLRLGARSLDLVGRRRARRRRCQRHEHRRAERGGKALRMPTHAARSPRTTLEHPNCPHNAAEITSPVISGQMTTRISARNRHAHARHKSARDGGERSGSAQPTRRVRSWVTGAIGCWTR